jgi:superfamily I DNA/RNA helicase
MNYRNIFYHALPAGVFRGRAITALNRARGICALLSAWQPNDTIAQRSTDISGIIGNLYGAQEVLEWQNYSLTFPQDTTLEELRNLLWADTDEQQALLLQAIYDRLNIPVPAVGLLPAKVRIMTMHGAKGLSGRIVFIPGLEGEILPGPKRRPFPGLVLEAARMLYVSITRARAACILSYANTRIVNGNFNNQTPSQFCPQLGGPFINRTNGLTPNEIHDIIQTCALL